MHMAPMGQVRKNPLSQGHFYSAANFEVAGIVRIINRIKFAPLDSDYARRALLIRQESHSELNTIRTANAEVVRIAN